MLFLKCFKMLKKAQVFGRKHAFKSPLELQRCEGGLVTTEVAEDLLEWVKEASSSSAAFPLWQINI